MSDKFESLSALMDGESSELELRRTLKQAAQDAEMSDTWRRYHLAQAIVKGQRFESSIDTRIDISAAVMAAIEDQEQNDGQTIEAGRVGWMHGAASVAVAASVTIAVLLGVQNFGASSSATHELQQAGVIERTNFNESLLPTSIGGKAASADAAPAIEVIRLSEEMRGAIQGYKQTVTTVLNTDWQPGWLPQGYTNAGVQLSDQGLTRLYSRDGTLLTLSVQPLTDNSPAPGSYSDQGVTALGRIVDQKFVSLVGPLSLDDADRVIGSLEWSATATQ